MQIIEFVPLLSMVQEHISSRYAAALTDTSKLPQLKSYIEKFIRDGGYGAGREPWRPEDRCRTHPSGGSRWTS